MIVEFSINSPFDSQKKARFTVVTQTGKYDVAVPIDSGIPFHIAADCDCEFGSHWGLSKKNKAVNKVCRHLNECITFLERDAWIDPDWRQRKDGTERKETKNEDPSGQQRNVE